jgi:hypothetical protein
VLWTIAVVGLAGAVAFGIHGAAEVSPWIWAFIVVGVFLVLAYNLELFGGAVHSDLWFALAWGAFPVLTAYFAQTGELSVAAVLAAAACAVISAGQRALSTPVRDLRRRVIDVHGSITRTDGTVEPIDAGTLKVGPEKALRLMSIAMPLLASAMIFRQLV